MADRVSERYRDFSPRMRESQFCRVANFTIKSQQTMANNGFRLAVFLFLSCGLLRDGQAAIFSIVEKMGYF
jgi:hypothetical protein